MDLGIVPANVKIIMPSLEHEPVAPADIFGCSISPMKIIVPSLENRLCIGQVALWISTKGHQLQVLDSLITSNHNHMGIVLADINFLDAVFYL